MKPSVRKILLNSAAPYSGAQLVLDFVGSRSNGQPYYMLNGAVYPRVDRVPGWTYTGGTAAGVGSYAARQDGSLQFFPSYTNLLLQSQTFDNASWTKSSATISADATTAPDGTTTADKIIEAAAASSHAIIQASAKSTVATTYTFSVYLKADTRTRAALWMNGAASGDRVEVGVNLSTGALLSSASASGGFTAAAATVVSAGNGYYRVTLTGTSDASASVQGRVFLLDNVATASSPSYTGDGTSGIYAWGAQLELGSTASTYIPTTTAAVTVGTPRITDAGYLAEEARTNLLLRSQEFDNASWGAGAVTVTANAITAPDGTLTADKVVPSTATSVHQLLQSVTHTAAGYTISVYAKPSGYDRIAIRENTTSGAYVVASLTGAGSILANSVGTSTVTAAADGWYRLTMTWTAAAVSQQMAFYVIGPGYTSGSPHSYTWAGDGTSGVYFWGAQDELGSFATSPIPTTSVAVTRAADVGYVSGLVVPSAYTLMSQGTVSAQTSGFPQMFGLDSGAVTDQSLIYFNSSALYGQVNVGGVAQALLALGAASNSTTYSAAMRVAANDFAAVRTGGSVATDAAGSVPTTTILRVGRGAGGSDWNGPIRRIVIYPRAFGNAELQAITTAGAY